MFSKRRRENFEAYHLLLLQSPTVFSSHYSSSYLSKAAFQQGENNTNFYEIPLMFCFLVDWTRFWTSRSTTSFPGSLILPPPSASGNLGARLVGELKEIMTSGNARKKKFIEFYMTCWNQSNMASSSDGAASQTGAIIEVKVKLRRNDGHLNLCDLNLCDC